MVSQNTLFMAIFFHLLDGNHVDADTENTSEDEAEQGSSKQEDQSKKIKDLVPKRGSTSVAWTWFGYEKSEMD